MKNVDLIKKQYRPGMRVRLILMEDPYPHPQPGSLGTVAFVDDIGTVHVSWDCGSSLGLVVGVDQFQVVVGEAL